MVANLILKLEPYDPDAIDGDNDGIVQEGTAWERPAGARLLLASGLEISRGETSAARPQGMRVVGANGKDVQYTPSWQKGQAAPQPGQSPTALADVGVRSLREMGLRDLRASTAPPKPPAPSKEKVQAVSKPKATTGSTKLDPKAVAETAAALHDAWRAGRKLPDGTYEPRMKDDGDGGEIDIANTDYADLPEKWQAENKASAEAALRAITENPNAGIEELAAIVHEQWLERNGSWASEEQKVDYRDLSESEKQKDRDVVNAARAALEKTETGKAKPDQRLERDWEDFSDLSNNDLNDLKNYVQDLLDDARFEGEDEKVADLRPKVMAMQAEQKIRFNEGASKERAQQEATQAALWEELFGGDQPRFGRQVSRDSFAQLGGAEAAEVFAFLNEALRDAERVSEDKRWEVRDPEKWTKSDEYARYSALADLRNNLSIEILDKVKKDADGVRERVRESQSLDREGLDKLLTDLYNVRKLAEITANREVAEEVGKATKAIERRLKNGVGPAETRPANAAGINKEIYGDAVPRPVDVRRPTLADPSPANGMPEPKVFGEGMSDEEAQAAIKRLRDGGSLSDIPNKYWAQALRENSSREEFDGESMFYEINPTESGAIADTYIYILRNPDGSPGNQGYVVKSGINERDATREVIGWNLAVAHGINPEGAMWGGFSDARQDDYFVVLPHYFNGVPAGDPQMGYSNYDLELAESPGALPAVFSNLLHNYLLSLTDRHSGNGAVIRVGDKTFAIPLDQSWGDSSSRKTLAEYNKEMFWMHRTIMRDMRNVIGMSADEQREHYAKMQAVYDEMLQRAERVVAEGEDSFAEKAMRAAPGDPGVERQAREVFLSYERKTKQLRKDRNKFLSDLWTPTTAEEYDEDDEFDDMGGVTYA